MSPSPDIASARGRVLVSVVRSPARPDPRRGVLQGWTGA